MRALCRLYLNKDQLYIHTYATRIHRVSKIMYNAIPLPALHSTIAPKCKSIYEKIFYPFSIFIEKGVAVASGGVRFAYMRIFIVYIIRKTLCKLWTFTLLKLVICYSRRPTWCYNTNTHTLIHTLVNNEAKLSRFLFFKYILNDLSVLSAISIKRQKLSTALSLSLTLNKWTLLQTTTIYALYIRYIIAFANQILHT